MGCDGFVRKVGKSSRKVLTRTGIWVGSSPSPQRSDTRDESRSRHRKGPIGFLVPSLLDLSQAWPGQSDELPLSKLKILICGLLARFVPEEVG